MVLLCKVNVFVKTLMNNIHNDDVTLNNVKADIDPANFYNFYSYSIRNTNSRFCSTINFELLLYLNII